MKGMSRDSAGCQFRLYDVALCVQIAADQPTSPSWWRQCNASASADRNRKYRAGAAEFSIPARIEIYIWTAQLAVLIKCKYGPSKTH